MEVPQFGQLQQKYQFPPSGAIDAIGHHLVSGAIGQLFSP